MVGQTLSHYRVVDKLGAGGMGEVYRAQDTKLGREVAIKVLPDAFARDPERLARFEREAQLLASLNHPNIAAIYGVEESDSVRFLVLELVPGQTLAERLAAGPLSLDEALGFCRQIAEALETAHEKGIIHRDLKPGNVKVTPEGKVKVLDFGLAKAFGAEAAAADLSKSPTLTTPGTQQGIVLGTAAYMSPEQARGKPLDKRTDIWSFGCVLYETLTGRQVFSGETVTDTIAAIVKEEPDWRALPPHTPANIQLLLHRCLQKEPGRRIHDIADVRIEIEEALTGPPRATVPAISIPRPAGWRRAIPWGLAAMLTVIAAFALWTAWRATSRVVRPLSRFLIVLPPNQRLSLGLGPSVALSPDGRHVVYVARAAGGASQLYLRPVDQLEATPLPGTEGANSPFFSPDGQWVGFFATAKLKKVSVTGGAVLNICDAPGAYGLGASWGSDGTIVFSPAPNTGLRRVSAAGGTPQVLTTLDPKKAEVSHRWPEMLPGGKAVLFTVASAATSSYDDARIAVRLLDTGEQRTLVEGGSNAHYAPTGHLVYGRGGALLAVPFDLGRLEVTGAPLPVMEGVLMDRVLGAAYFSFAADGSLVYIPGGVSAPARSLFWVDRKGAAWPITETHRAYAQLSLSPDGRRVALTIREANSDVWVYELARGTLTRFTFEPEEDEWPIWTPDGQRVTFSSQRGVERKLFWKLADGSGAEEQLLAAENHQHATSWSPDGRVLAFEELHPTTGWDLWVLEFEGKPPGAAASAAAAKPRPFLRTPFAERDPQFSPDGRWLAYFSNESGQDEVYVQPFPGPGGKWQISTAGGAWPHWARNGRELYYRNGDKILAVAIATQPTFSPATPRPLFDGWYEYAGMLAANYDIAPDGQRFLMSQESEKQSAPTQLPVVLNWFEDLKRRVPAGKK